MRSCVGRPAVSTMSPSSSTKSPTRSFCTSAFVSGSFSRYVSPIGSLEAFDTAVVIDARRSPPVDPAVETHRDRREAVARRVLHMHRERRGIAARAHRSEAGLVHGLEQALLHVGEDRFRVLPAERP